MAQSNRPVSPWNLDAQHAAGATGESDISPWEYENGFYYTSNTIRMAKLIAYYELYKKILHLPGEVVEVGVFKGTSFLRFCTFRQMLESPYSRKIIGFDSFGDFPLPEGNISQDDKDFVSMFTEKAGVGLSKEKFENILDANSFANYDLVEGDIHLTMPAYIQEHPALRIALLHIDVDIHAPTFKALEELYDMVVPGGLILFDDYAQVSGATEAIEEFFKMKSLESIFQKLPFSHKPSYIIKPAL